MGKELKAFKSRHLLVYSKADEGDGFRAGIFTSSPMVKLSVSLGKLTRIFQKETYAIDTCAELMYVLCTVL